MNHKKYPVSKEEFKYFCHECRLVMPLLGQNGAPTTYAFELPPQADKYHLGGSIQYEDSQKVLIYLNPKWPREVTRNKLKYLGAHEPIELLLMEKFLSFAEECAKSGVVDYKKWDEIVHNALNRLMMLYDPDLMTDIAEGPVFEEK